MRTGAVAAVVCILCGASAPALAEPADSSAELATGGLVFVQNPDLQMRSEELYVSPSEIRVTYHFFNSGKQDVTDLVAFPMPDVTIANQDAMVAIPALDPQNFLAFTTTANGQPVTAQVEQKAFVKDTEQTALLQQLKVPLAPQLQETYDALDAVPQAQWADLVNLGLVEALQYDDGTGKKPHLEPRWTLKTTYSWQQIFPAQQEIVIQHRYQPSVGESVETQIGNPNYPVPPDYRQKYCLDDAFLAAAGHAWQEANRTNSRQLAEERIDYILKTGENGTAAIPDFTATIDKGDTNALVSFCATGAQKLGPTQQQIHLTNFTPTSDLYVVILTKQPIQY
jgi:hypothetical protein